MRKVKVKLSAVLDLLASAETQGFGGTAFFESAFEWIAPLSDAEIEEYSNSYITPEMKLKGYTAEDVRKVRRTLRRLRRKYERQEGATKASKK